MAMTIDGLAQNNFCVHNPLVVRVRVDPVVANEELLVRFEDVQSGEVIRARISNVSRQIPQRRNTYYIDLSPWARQFLPPFENYLDYGTAVNTSPNPYRRQIEMTFQVTDADSKVLIVQQETRNFLHCVTNTCTPPDPTCCVKAWKCYPISFRYGELGITWFIPDQEICNFIPNVCENIDYDNACCKGTYLKWLNCDGWYNYWLFPRINTTDELEGEVKDVMTRWPGSQFTSGGTPPACGQEKPSGIELTKTTTVRDTIPCQFWPTFDCLLSSPEIYMLRPNWKPGVDTFASGQDWFRLQQEDVTFEKNHRNNISEFEATFSFGKQYTQNEACF